MSRAQLSAGGQLLTAFRPEGKHKRGESRGGPEGGARPKGQKVLGCPLAVRNESQTTDSRSQLTALAKVQPAGPEECSAQKSGPKVSTHQWQMLPVCLALPASNSGLLQWKKGAPVSQNHALGWAFACARCVGHGQHKGSTRSSSICLLRLYTFGFIRFARRPCPVGSHRALLNSVLNRPGHLGLLRAEVRPHDALVLGGQSMAKGAKDGAREGQKPPWARPNPRR